MNLKELENKTILLFGKSRAFRDEEFSSQMIHHKIGITQEFNDTLEYVVEGRMMTPYEQNESARLYETEDLTFIEIDELDGELAKEIDEDTLLMSLKLSHDKERLKNFLQNAKISNKLFFRLLKMYSWSGEDFFENDENRDVSAAFISRFYENIERNHNVQFATTGFIHLVAQTKSSELLQEITLLQPLQFHPKIELAIAMSIYCDEKLQKKLFKRGDEKVLEALSLNKKLNAEIVQEFLKDENLGSNIAQTIELDEKLFELLKKDIVNLSLNETLTLEMQEELLAYEKSEVNYALSLNHALDKSVINSLLLLEDEKLEESIYENPSTPVEILEEAYKDEKNHLSLAKNESTPIEILYQLQLDSRYDRFVKKNAGYGKHIQTQNIGWLV